MMQGQTDSGYLLLDPLCLRLGSLGDQGAVLFGKQLHSVLIPRQVCHL